MTILAYILLVIGIPNYVGQIGSVVFMPLAWSFDYPARLYVIQLFSIPAGVISIIAAKAMFYLFGVPLHWPILAISLAWITSYFWAYKQPKLGWASFVVGMILGWYISPW